MANRADPAGGINVECAGWSDYVEHGDCAGVSGRGLECLWNESNPVDSGFVGLFCAIREDSIAGRVGTVLRYGGLCVRGLGRDANTSFVECAGKDNCEVGTGLGLYAERATQLLGKNADHFQAHGFKIFDIETGWQARALIGDTERHHSLWSFTEPNQQIAAGDAGVSIFESVGDQLTQDKSTGYGLFNVEEDGRRFEVGDDFVRSLAERREDIRHQRSTIILEVNRLKLHIAIQLLMN